MEIKKFSSDFRGLYRGKVVNNNDPSKYGQIQVRVYPMFADVIPAELTNLPWAKPAFPLGTGSGLYTPDPDDPKTWVSYGVFNVPDVDTFVFVFFENGDLYQPVYFAEAPTAEFGLPSLKNENENYPNVRGFRTKSGNVFFIDDAINHIKLLHATGTYAEVQSDGNVYVQPIPTKRSIHRALSHTVVSRSSGSLNGQDGGLILVSGSGTLNCPNASDYKGLIYRFKRIDDGLTVVNCPPAIEDDTYFELGSASPPGGKWAGKSIISTGSIWVTEP
jgi:hypothetical protein